MDESEFDEILEVNQRKCEGCKIRHICMRCIKNMHICTKCGKMSHDCDICGTIMNSLTEIKKHQKESKICRKAKTLTAKSFEEQLVKAGIQVTNKHHRRSSLPIIKSIGVVS